MSPNFNLNNFYKNLSIRNKLIMSFFWILLFVLISFGYLFWSSMNDDLDSSYKTDVAGRMQMSSQKIAALTFLMTNKNENIRNEAKEELIKTIDLFESIIKTLKDGGIIEGTDYLLKPTIEKNILINIRELEILFSDYHENVKILIDNHLFVTTPSYITINSNALESSIEQIINPIVENALQRGINDFIKGDILKTTNKLTELYAENDAKIKSDKIKLRNILFSILLSMIIIVIALNFVLMRKYIVIPIGNISDIANKIAEGNLSVKITYNNIKDELGRIGMAINTLVNNLRESAQFVVQIGQGNFDAKYNVKISEDIDIANDNLGIALLNMRDRLKSIAENDKSRKWATEGFAKFGDILRLNNNDFKELSNSIISNLVKYLKANQGCMFIINDNNNNDFYLELVACYAFEKKKYLSKRISKGEGIVGQAWQEGDYIYLTEVPNNYINITSGLGGANPRSILIMPLKINEEIFGIIELASFEEFCSYEIEFVQKLSESIASTISTAKVNIRTKELLEISQLQTEAMKAQEEEMRQNMEELAATQDEMSRKGAELEIVLNAVNSTIGTIEYDLHGCILSVNKFFLDITEMKEKDVIGKKHYDFVNKNIINDKDYNEIWDKISDGITHKCEMNYIFPNGKKIWLLETYNPIKDMDGNIIKALTGVIAINKNLLLDVQQQNETMKAQDEELRQNIEEIAAMNEAIEKEQEEFKKLKENELKEQIRITNTYEDEITSMMNLWTEHLEGAEKMLAEKYVNNCNNNK